MTKAINYISTVLITAAIVGGGVYYWQEQRVPVYESKTGESVAVWRGEGFMFEYPEKYVINEKGLWTEEGLQRYENPPENCSVCTIPYVGVETATTDLKLEQYAYHDYALPEKPEDLYHMTIGGNDFVKLTVSDKHDVSAYYTQHGDMVIAFKIYSTWWILENPENLVEMLASLQFEE